MFYHYILLYSGHGRALLPLFFGFLTELAFFCIPLWISVWLGKASTDQAWAIGFYIGVHGAILLSFSPSSALSQSYFHVNALKVASCLRKKLLAAAMRVSLDRFDQNPPGRVLNHFSRDIFSLDSTLVGCLRIAFDNAVRFLLRLTAIGSIMPIFAISCAIVCYGALVCAEMYTRTQIHVRALSSAAQSPIFSLFEESMAGRSTISARAGMKESFADGLASRLRVYARAAETQHNLNWWIRIRADGCAAVIALATGVLTLSLRLIITPGLVGLSLTNAIGLGQTIINLVRNMNGLEVRLNCLQQVTEYNSILPEENVPHKAVDPSHICDHSQLAQAINACSAMESFEGLEAVSDTDTQITSANAPTLKALRLGTMVALCAAAPTVMDNIGEVIIPENSSFCKHQFNQT